MSVRPHLRVRGENIHVGDVGAAVFLDPIGEVVNVAATVTVERIQLFDPLTGESDPVVWFRRIRPEEAATGPDGYQPLWEVRRRHIQSFYPADAPAASQAEFDFLMHRLMPDGDQAAEQRHEATEDAKMETLHAAIDGVIEKLDLGREEWNQEAREHLLELAHAVQGLT